MARGSRRDSLYQSGFNDSWFNHWMIDSNDSMIHWFNDSIEWFIRWWLNLAMIHDGMIQWWIRFKSLIQWFNNLLGRLLKWFRISLFWSSEPWVQGVRHVRRHDDSFWWGINYGLLYYNYVTVSYYDSVIIATQIFKTPLILAHTTLLVTLFI